MKKILSLSLLVGFLFTIGSSIQAQNLEGTWERKGALGDQEISYVMLVSGSYFSWTAFYTADGAFIATKGGSFKTMKNELHFTYEFDTADSTMVGVAVKHGMSLKGKNLTLDGTFKWKQTDGGVKSPLAGSWLISGRKRGEEIVKRSTDGPRKTMKILTPTRFQWIAYNTETKQFMGTGGGAYTAVNGKYTENIEFFSRDKSRVGASLGFDFEVKDGDWHHSGKSSKGDPIYEVWSIRMK
jgi:hypothetical protein